MSKPINMLPSNIPFVSADGLINPSWYIFLQSIFTRVGGAVSQTNNELIDGQFDDAGIDEIKSDLYVLRDQVASMYMAVQAALDNLDTAPVTPQNNFYDPARVAITGGTASGLAITSSTINSTAIGSTAASTGKFTDVTNGNAAALIKTSVSMNNGAAGFAATLLNAPVAGNPTKWVPWDDNGTIRYYPSW